MNTNGFDIDDRALDDALRALDVADRSLDESQLTRKQALLRDLLTSDALGEVLAGDAPRGGAGKSGDTTATADTTAAADTTATTSATTSTPATSTAAPVVPISAGRRGRLSPVRWLIPAAAAAALVGAMVIGGQSGEKAAYASWTPDPTPVTGEVLSRAEAACRAGWSESSSRQADLPPDLRPITKAEDLATVVAEQRGDYLFLAMAADDGSTTQCFFDADDPSRPHGMTGGAATGGTPLSAVLAPEQIEGSGGGAASGPEGSYAFAVGRVGEDVKGVTVHAEGTDVRATVTNGHFAAWWPSKPVQEPAPSQDLRFEVTLADGTVRSDVDAGPGAPRVTEPGPRQVGALSRGGGVSDQGSVATVAGHVGSEVVGVTIDVGGRKVAATVSDGTFSAEWPSPTEGSVPPLTFDLTLRDGTVLTGQQPAEGESR